MQQQISVVTLGIADLVRSRRFYREGFGHETHLPTPHTGLRLAHPPHDRSRADLAAAIEARGLIAVNAEGLALHTQVVLQGAFVLAKATGGSQVARESVDHLKHYFRLLFSRETLTQKGNVS